jgi:hypothetical protein
MFLKQWLLESKISMYFAEHSHESIGAEALAERLRKRPADVAEVLLKMLDHGLLIAEPYPEEMLFSLNTEHPSISHMVHKMSVNRWRTVLSDHLWLVNGVRRAVAYWPQGEEGPLRVLVVGAVNHAALETAIRKSEDQLKQSIGLLQMTVADHEDKLRHNDAILRTIYSGHYKVIIDLDID